MIQASDTKVHVKPLERIIEFRLKDRKKY